MCNKVIIAPFPWIFLLVRNDCLKQPESNESDDFFKEESDELGSESGSFGMSGTCLGGLLHDAAFYVGVTPVGGDWPFNGVGG